MEDPKPKARTEKAPLLQKAGWRRHLTGYNGLVTALIMTKMFAAVGNRVVQKACASSSSGPGESLGRGLCRVEGLIGATCSVRDAEFQMKCGVG